MAVPRSHGLIPSHALLKMPDFHNAPPSNKLPNHPSPLPFFCSASEPVPKAFPRNDDIAIVASFTLSRIFCALAFLLSVSRVESSVLGLSPSPLSTKVIGPS